MAEIIPLGAKKQNNIAVAVSPLRIKHSSQKESVNPFTNAAARNKSGFERITAKAVINVEKRI